MQKLHAALLIMVLALVAACATPATPAAPAQPPATTIPVTRPFARPTATSTRSPDQQMPPFVRSTAAAQSTIDANAPKAFTVTIGSTFSISRPDKGWQTYKIVDNAPSVQGPTGQILIQYGTGYQIKDGDVLIFSFTLFSDSNETWVTPSFPWRKGN